MDQDIGLLGREVRKSRCWASQAELVLIIGAEGSYGGVYYSQTAAADRACCLRHRHSELRCWKYSIFSCHSRFNRVCGGPQYNGVSEYSIAIAATCFALFVPSGCGYDSHGESQKTPPGSIPLLREAITNTFAALLGLTGNATVPPTFGITEHLYGLQSWRHCSEWYFFSSNRQFL